MIKKILLNENQYTAAKLASDGLLNKQIARLMGKDKTSVDGYLYQFREKTGAKGRAEFWKWVYPTAPHAKEVLCVDDTDYVIFALEEKQVPLSMLEIKDITGFSKWKTRKCITQLRAQGKIRIVRIAYEETKQVKYVLEGSKF